jgi:hypothetical protein
MIYHCGVGMRKTNLFYAAGHLLACTLEQAAEAKTVAANQAAEAQMVAASQAVES